MEKSMANLTHSPRKPTFFTLKSVSYHKLFIFVIRSTLLCNQNRQKLCRRGAMILHAIMLGRGLGFIILLVFGDT